MASTAVDPAFDPPSPFKLSVTLLSKPFPALVRLKVRVAVLALIIGCPGWGQAIVDEALNIALEVAVPFIEEGFQVRDDTWSGEVPSNEPKLVRHQLFRGNEYWFWLGSSTDDSELTLEVFDSEGNSVGIESFSKGKTAGVRVLPSKTGTYFLRVTVKSKTDEEATLDWALVYGYR